MTKLRSLFERLFELQALGWEEGVDFNIESTLDLIEFMELHPELVRPSVVLAPGGNVHAVWKNRERGEHLAIAFHGGGVVSYVIFAPGFLSVAGKATMDDVLQIAEPYGVVPGD